MSRRPTPVSRTGLVCAVPEPFLTVWSVRHHLLSRLSKVFWTVWMEPLAYWQDHGMEFKKPSCEQDQDYPGMMVLRNGFLREFYKPKAVARFIHSKRLKMATAALRARGCDKLVLYLWRPEYSRYLDLAQWDLTLYHIDDEYSFSSEDVPVSHEEELLLRNVDHAIIHSPGLLEKKGHYNPRTHWIPNGVDFELFSQPRAIPSDLSEIPSPRIGYAGIVKDQLDWDLLRHIAEQHPDWSIVLVGPRGYLGRQQSKVDELVARPNVHELGGRSLSELPSYMQHFDVAMMCYGMDDYTKYIYPLKLHEYLACGVPIVASPIRTLLDFEHVVSIAATPEEWVDKIEQALDPLERSSSAKERRQAVAAEYDWQALTDQVSSIVVDALSDQR